MRKETTKKKLQTKEKIKLCTKRKENKDDKLEKKVNEKNK